MKSIHINNEELYYKFKIQAIKEKKTIIELVEELIKEHLRKKDNERIRNIDPETIETVKEVIKKEFLTKDGKKFKTIKKYWTEDLIKKILPKLDFEEDIVLECMNKLIESELLINNYKNEVKYNWELQENIDNLVYDEND
ncbi:hypothetical protein LCGC14_0540300 [marine sediment metagenome]|uniref:Uncharacterized protein n=1 Tax=marine sediment metagenome TaxID=412755 RepID=A0A0F9V194_9ZZZZ